MENTNVPSLHKGSCKVKLRQDPEHVDAMYPEIISSSFSPTKLLYSLKSNSALHIEECIPLYV